MSPDILQGFNIGLHDDIYSFGITMWQLKSSADPYSNIPSNEFVAYHVVKSNLRPDSQTEYFVETHNKENEENLKTINSAGSTTSGSDNSKSPGYHPMAVKQPQNFFTPNNIRKPLKTQFLSAGHNKKHIKGTTTTVSSNVVKKLDFNSTVNRIPLTPRLVNRNLSTVKHKIHHHNESTSVFDNKWVVALFKDSYQHLTNEKKMEIENAYENIYKKCWTHEAVKRPNAQTILDLLNSTIHSFG